MAIPAIGGRPTRGMSGTTAKAQKMVATLNIAGESDGNEEPMQRVQHAHQRDRDGDGRQKRQHDSRQLGRELQLSGTAANSAPAIAWVIGSAKMMPSTTSMPVTSSSALMTRLPRRHAGSRPARSACA